MNIMPKNKKIEAELNLTPLIDVVFLLLIFFMVSTKFDVNQRRDIDLPISNNPLLNSTNSIPLFVDIDNLVTIKQQVFNINELGKISEKLKDLKNSGLEHLTVYADADLNYQTFVTLMESITSAGIKKVSFSVNYSK